MYDEKNFEYLHDIYMKLDVDAKYDVCVRMSVSGEWEILIVGTTRNGENEEEEWSFSVYAGTDDVPDNGREWFADNNMIMYTDTAHDEMGCVVTADEFVKLMNERYGNKVE